MARNVAIGLQDFGDVIQKDIFILIRLPLSRNGGKRGTVLP